jgi:predicted nucleic acid-binding protein
MPFLVDNDVLIDVSRDNPGAVEYVDGLDGRALSQATALELMVGARNRLDLNMMGCANTIAPLPYP